MSHAPGPPAQLRVARRLGDVVEGTDQVVTVLAKIFWLAGKFVDEGETAEDGAVALLAGVPRAWP